MVGSVLFRVDGGNVYSVGMGHVYRCVRIAVLLCERNIDCFFVMKDYPEGIDFVKEAGFTPVVIDKDMNVEDEVAETLSNVSKNKSILFVDMRMPRKLLVDGAMKENITTVVYEDISTEELAPSVLLNPSPIARNEERYNNEGTEYLLGEDYLVLDPAISSYQREIFSPIVKKVFLCFGGADPINLSSRVLRVLLERNEDMAIDIAIGPAFKNLEEIDRIMSERDVNKRINRIIGNNSLAGIATFCDAAMTSGGTCFFETISQNIPTLGLPTIYSEAQIVSKMMDEGLADGIKQDVDEIDDNELRDKIDSFLNDNILRERIFKNQLKKNLSLGLFRVVDCLDVLTREMKKED